MHVLHVFSQVVRIADVLVAERAHGHDSVGILEAILDVLVAMLWSLEMLLAEWTDSGILVHELLQDFRGNDSAEMNFSFELATGIRLESGFLRKLWRWLLQVDYSFELL